MRTTVTLDPDTEQLLRQRMKERGISFKQALNEAVREGLAGRRPPRQFRTRTAPMGRPTVSLDKALQLAGDLEDEELLRRMRAGK
ncbi:antitoxin [Quadrisphaera sp. GCM10027208]|uniref:antitoxin n=1 Tax=Quadrisphaera sp. GCM10027208 TaxID=3273423 RepID=UPI003611C44C